MWDTPFDPDAGFEAAARVLCSAQYLEHEQGGGVWTTDDEATFMRLDSTNCLTHERSVHAGCFESHTTLVLPDNPPIKPCPVTMRHTSVHRFVLSDGVAAAINGHLLSEAVRHSQLITGSSRSNVGGYHSIEEVWQGGGSSGDWYGRLHNVVLEAVRVLSADADAGTPGGAGGNSDADLHVSGWFNVSGAREFNTLHDHGDALWAAVYYVARGGEAAAGVGSSDDGGESDMETDTDDARAAGSLVLKTQLVPCTHTFGYLPIPPRAGDLWIFPGHLSHAVLPRTLLPPPPPAAAAAAAGSAAMPVPCDGAPRVSVAINVQRKASAADGGSPTDQGVARALRRMYPADPDFRPAAAAQKLD